MHEKSYIAVSSLITNVEEAGSYPQELVVFLDANLVESEGSFTQTSPPSRLEHSLEIAYSSEALTLQGSWTVQS